MSAYRTQSSDTTLQAETILIAAYRGMSPAEKVRRLTDLTLACRDWARSGIRSRHPHADEREIELRLASLRLDRDSMVRWFGWDPREKGYG